MFEEKKMSMGRFFGWFFLISAGITASAETLAALGAENYVSIATGDVVTIVTGITPFETNSFFTRIFHCPAWFSMALAGGLLTFFCRKKKVRSAFE